MSTANKYYLVSPKKGGYGINLINRPLLVGRSATGYQYRYELTYPRRRRLFR